MITINNKQYEMPEWNFGNIRKIEKNGLSIVKIFDPANYMFTFLNAFVAVTVGCDSEQADYLIDQHVQGGGDITELFKEFSQSLTDSPFFKRTVESIAKSADILQKTEQKKATAKN